MTSRMMGSLAALRVIALIFSMISGGVPFATPSPRQAPIDKSILRSLSVGTFSKNGPTKCSGLEIKQYSEESMTEKFEENFEKIRCINENHETPFNTVQNFTFCTFQRR